MTSFLLALGLSRSALAAPATAQRVRGAYGSGQGDFVVMSARTRRKRGPETGRVH